MITLTDNLVTKIKAMQEQESDNTLMLRVQVNGGGCQGFEYEFKTDTEVKDDDQTFEKDGITVIIDEVSMPFLENSEIDYVDDLIGAYFKVNNPNATSSCGCGTSFSV